MKEYEVEMNDVKIFTEIYTKKIFLKGFIISDKYPDNDFKEKRINFFLESHGHKYQLNVVCSVDNCEVTGVDIELEEVEKYNISYKIEPYIEQYHCIVNEQIRIIELATLSKDDEMKFTKTTKNFFGEEKGLITENRLILLNRIKNFSCPYIPVVQDTYINSKEFINLLLSKEDAEEYNKNLLEYQLKDLRKML